MAKSCIFISIKLSKITGRHHEIESLNKAFQSKKAEMIALYGRRRFGKTYLVRSLLQNKNIYLEVVGLKDGKMSDQIEIFTKALADVFYSGAPLQVPKSWKEKFKPLKGSRKQKKIFFYV